MVDLFGGGGSGWSLAARELGIPCIGVEWAAPECSTRAAAGLLTLRADVATYPWQPPHVARQIGNAVPPPLALACLRAVTG